MEFENVIRERRAIRNYKDQSIPDEKMKKLYEALQLAPSGNNHQPYRFIFVKDADTRKKIAEKATHQEFFYQAPVVMVAVCDKDRAFDVAIAVDHMILAAANEGLGTCWVGWFEPEVIKEILGLPADQEVPIIVPIGYADESPEQKPRKSIEELIEVK